MSKSLTIGWLIPATVLTLSIECYVPDKHFATLPKVDRIASSASQEWLFTKDPNKEYIDRSGIDLLSYPQDHTYFWQALPLGQQGGRIRDVLHIEQDSLHYIYAASASGGVYRSVSESLADYQWAKTTLTETFVSSLAYDSVNKLLYAGTGEGYYEHKSFPGTGVYRSEDFGLTWTLLTATSHLDYVQDIEVVGDRLYISSLSNGLLFSIDFGESVSQVLTKAEIGPHASVNDIVSVGEEAIVVSTGIQNEGGIFKSLHSKLDFQQVPLDIDEKVKRIELANNQSTPSTLYAVAQDYDSGQATTFRKSIDGGTTWTRKSLPVLESSGDFAGGQAWYNLSLAVHPTNPNWVILGGIDLYLSKNGGNSWVRITDRHGNLGLQTMHADQHCITFINDTEVLIGNDGGVYLIEDVFTDGRRVTPINEDLLVGQCYAGVYDHHRAQYIIGTQDNGTLAVQDSSSIDVTELIGGDGGYVHIDSDNPEMIIASYIKNNYFISRDGGEQFHYREFSNEGLFTNPSVYDDKRNVLYAAEAPGKLLRWNNPLDLGKHVDIIKLRNADAQVTSLLVSKHKADRVFFGNADGELLYLDFAFVGTNRQAFQIAKFEEGGTIKEILEDPLNPNSLYVVLSNYGIQNIYSTHDFGKTWLSHDGNLPDIPVRDLHISDSSYLIATDRGLWQTHELAGDKTHWKSIESPFKYSNATQILTTDDKDEIAVLTYGSGIYIGSKNLAFEVVNDRDTLDLTESVVSSTNCTTNYSEYMVNIETIGCNDTLTVEASLEHLSSNSLDLALQQNTIATVDNQVELGLILYDDALLEHGEQAKLHVVCSCGGNTKSKEILINIYDNDKPITQGASSITSMIGEFDAETDHYPFRAYYEDAKSAFVISASELLASGLSAGDIQSLDLYILKKQSDIPLKSLTISLSTEDRNAANAFGEFTEVFQSDYTTIEGWNTFILEHPYFWNGVDDLWVQVCFNNNQWSSSDKIACHVTEEPSVFYSYADSSIGCEIEQVMKSSKLRPTTRITMGGSVESASVINSRHRSSIDSQSNLIFRDTYGKLVLSVESNSSQNLACYEAEIIEVEDLVHELDIFSWTFNTKLYDISQEGSMSLRTTLYFNQSEFDFIDKSKTLYLLYLEGDEIVSEEEFNMDDFKTTLGLLEYTFENTGDTRIVIVQKTELDYRERSELEYDITTADFTLSPNPFQNAFRIEYDLPEGIELTGILMISPNGKEVPVEIEQRKGVANIFPDNAIPPSWYFLKVELSNQEYKMFKVIKH